ITSIFACLRPASRRVRLDAFFPFAVFSNSSVAPECRARPRFRTRLRGVIMDRSPFSWLERELLLLLAIVSLGYFIGLEYPALRGEESRRAQVAVEILRTGDWIVPRQQGELFLSRPPAGSWPIAFFGMLRGDVDVAAKKCDRPA